MRPVFFVLCLFFTLQSTAQSKFEKLDELIVSNASNIAGKNGGYEIVLAKDGKIIYENARGKFDLQKTVFIASASKWYAGVVIMRLVDKGVIHLDDKISDFIPSFKNEKSSITIRQCFSHTSGLPGGDTEENVFKKHHFNYAAMVDDIARMDLVAAPGKQFNYGGVSMQVVGRVAEIATGKKWNKLFKEEVVEPLQLSNTKYFGDRLNNVPRIAGGVISNAADFLKLLEMISNGGRVNDKQFLSPTSLQLLLTNQMNGSTVGYSPYTKYAMSFETPGYGIGNWLLHIDESVINSSPGAFGFTPWIDLKKHYYGVISVKHHFKDVAPVFWKMLHIINTIL
jgi:CubicO group peptidase (beta-lactamase class C family)